jgi:hypothetical protein
MRNPHRPPVNRIVQPAVLVNRSRLGVGSGGFLGREPDVEVSMSHGSLLESTEILEVQGNVIR